MRKTAPFVDTFFEVDFYFFKKYVPSGKYLFLALFIYVRLNSGTSF